MIDLLKYKPPRIAMVLALITLIPSMFLMRIIEYPLNLSGIPIGLIGFGIMMWAWKVFQKEDIAICPTAKTAKITKGGPYKISRNPMYLGMVIILIGYSVIIGSIIAFLAPVLFFLIIDRVFIPYEENKLKTSFKEEYLNYSKEVRAWV